MYYKPTITEDVREIKKIVQEIQEQINDLTEEVINLKGEKITITNDGGKTFSSKESFIDSRDYGGLSYMLSLKRNNKPRLAMTRPQVIRKAKELVNDLLGQVAGGDIVEFIQSGKFDGKPPEIMAVLKEEVIMNGHTFYNVIDSDIAVCHIDDDFNEDIGKAIALHKLLGRSIPDYLMNAPKIGGQYIVN